MAQSEQMSREQRLLDDCEDALFRLSLARLEARRAEALVGEADAGDATLTPEAMDRAFERALPRILRVSRHALRNLDAGQLRRKVAARAVNVIAAFLVLLLVGCVSALAVSPEMRESLSRLLVNPQKKFTDFRMEDFAKPDVPDAYEGDFFPSYIPNGFALQSAGWNGACYLAESDRVLFYSELDENAAMNLDTENAEVTYGKVGGTDAMFVKKNGLSSIVWSFSNRFFVVSIVGTHEEAMKVAESLVVIDR
jgi:hypothetical protein